MKPEDLKLKNCWEGFATVAIPEGASEVQRDAMYMAFLSGCSTVLQLHESLEQHAPASRRPEMQRWETEVAGELQRLGERRQ